jgi:hypothetical protein
MKYKYFCTSCRNEWTVSVNVSANDVKCPCCGCVEVRNYGPTED